MPCAAPTTIDFENALLAMFASALAADEAFLDVTSRGLAQAVYGSGKAATRFGTCCDLMRRMMIPGDHELSSTYGHRTGGLLIRFRLPR